MKQSKSLIKKYHFYEKYHQNFYNKLVHILCIPMLVWTTTVFLTYIPSFVLTLGNYTFNLTVSGLIATLYVSYYLYLDFVIVDQQFYQLFFLNYFQICLKYDLNVHYHFLYYLIFDNIIFINLNLILNWY